MNRHIATLLRGSHFLNFSFFFRVSSLLVVFLNSVLLCSHALCEKKCNCNLLTLIVTYVSCPENYLRKVIPFIYNKTSNLVFKFIVQISKEKKSYSHGNNQREQVLCFDVIGKVTRLIRLFDEI